MGERINLEKWVEKIGSDKPVDLINSIDWLEQNDVDSITLKLDELRKLIVKRGTVSSRDERDPERFSIH